MSDVAGTILFVGVALYAVFGGADFGAGFWDLTAGGAARGRRPRALIDRALGPVWEANHVWLIFCLVVLILCLRPPAWEPVTPCGVGGKGAELPTWVRCGTGSPPEAR